MKSREQNLKRMQRRLQRPAKLLLVAANYDESSQIQSWINTKLSHLIQTVTVAYSFDEALLDFEFNHPDLILISSCSDEERVFDFARKVRTINGSRHVGMMVYFVDEILTDEFVIKCLTAGVDDCIPSYVNPEVKAARVQAVIQLKRMTDELRHANFQLKKMSITDDLTGLYNMRGFEKRLHWSVAACARKDSGLAVMMLDLDHFKSVNDTMNHLVGSHVIESIGKLIGTLATKGIYCGRYGGDEFIMIQLASNPEECAAFAEKVRSHIENKHFNYEGKTFHVTASIGVHWVEKGFKGTSSDLIKEADRMLYVSKEAGRNCVSCTHTQRKRRAS